MSGMMFDPELLKLWQAQTAAATAPPPGMELAKVGAAAPLPLPPPPPPPLPPPPLPVAGADAAAQPLPLPPPPPGAPAAGAAAGVALPDSKPEALPGGGRKDRQPFDLVALLRGLAEIVPRPTPPRRQAPSAAPPPPGHRPQGGTLPLRQATPGNPYLRGAAPGAAAIRPGRRGLLDES